jgi:hypothetical protein
MNQDIQKLSAVNQQAGPAQGTPLPLMGRDTRVHQNHIYTIYIYIYVNIYIQCIYGIFGREITKHTVIYGVYARF